MTPGVTHFEVYHQPLDGNLLIGYDAFAFEKQNMSADKIFIQLKSRYGPDRIMHILFTHRNEGIQGVRTALLRDSLVQS